METNVGGKRGTATTGAGPAGACVLIPTPPPFKLGHEVRSEVSLVDGASSGTGIPASVSERTRIGGACRATRALLGLPRPAARIAGSGDVDGGAEAGGATATERAARGVALG
jgi:hypothetical protein